MTNTPRAQTPDYQKELRKRCDAFAFEFRRNEYGDYDDELFYTFVREIALESYRNGVKAGRRGTSRKTGRTPRKGRQ